MTRSWRRYLRPPAGRQVRRLIAMITLAVGLPRLPVLQDLLPFASQRFLTPEVYGYAAVVLAVLLLVTGYDRRLTWQGRVVAGLAFVFYVTLAAATTSATSFLIDLMLAVSLLIEVGTMRDE